MVSPWREGETGAEVGAGWEPGAPSSSSYTGTQALLLPKTPATCHSPLNSQGTTEKRDIRPPSWSLCDLVPISSQA